MNELDCFRRLKDKVLSKYGETYPFFKGTWKTFSAQEIQNLIILIETNCKQSISEKWIYTHLKPEQNSKVPRKDMLDILSEFVGYSGWDELLFECNSPVDQTPVRKNKSTVGILLVLSVLLVGIIIWYFKFNKVENNTKTLELESEFTKQKVKNEEVKLYKVQGGNRQTIEIKEGKIKIENPKKENFKLEIISPFYKKKIINIEAKDTVSTKVALKPDDYAMMLKAFMLADIKDWQTRKMQLDKILADDLEVLIMLRDDLGVEYFNKQEFSQKLIVPTSSLKQMKIVEIENNASGKIRFVRIKQ